MSPTFDHGGTRARPALRIRCGSDRRRPRSDWWTARDPGGPLELVALHGGLERIRGGGGGRGQARAHLIQDVGNGPLGDPVALHHDRGGIPGLDVLEHLAEQRRHFRQRFLHGGGLGGGRGLEGWRIPLDLIDLRLQLLLEARLWGALGFLLELRHPDPCGLHYVHALHAVNPRAFRWSCKLFDGSPCAFGDHPLTSAGEESFCRFCPHSGTGEGFSS